MTVITVNYAAMAEGHDGLVATWGRIEGHLADLDTIVAGTAEMRSDTLTAYLALKQRWELAAADRQIALTGLAQCVADAADTYRSTDAQLAAMFLG